MTPVTFPAFIWNGSAFEPCNGLPLSDRGARYGMALFESFAIRNGRVELAAWHLEQLNASCRALSWPEVAWETIPDAMLETVGQGPVFARLYFTAGDGGPFDPVTAPRLFLFGERRETPLATGELRVITLPGEAFFAPEAPFSGGLKTGNYWKNLLSLQQARAAGASEALRENAGGEFFSACMANFFILLENELVTPPLSSGARKGAVREWVLGRRRVVERRICMVDLEKASECFLTSTWAGIVPASHLNSRPLATTLGGDLRAEWEDAIFLR